MADFTALKSAIQTYIKQNGNEEITGEKLQEILLSMVTTLGDSAINDLVTALNDEVAARQNADGTLQQNITNEATARGNADTALGGRIDDEATARANGDTALSDRLGSTITAENTAADQIGAEAEARAAADTALQELIDGITDNIANGYVYVGIATPSSTPATGKVFYLALTAGTYTNFGNTEVSQGINILKYNGSAWSLDTFVGIDDTPTPNSPNLVKSGGAFDSVMTNGSAFDISAHFASGGTLATYADLDAALAALNTLSASYKRGGMSIKFVQSSDNKYVQYRLMSDSFSTTEATWQKQGAEVNISQNTSTGYTDINIGDDAYPVASVQNVAQLNYLLNTCKQVFENDSQTDNLVCFRQGYKYFLKYEHFEATYGDMYYKVDDESAGVKIKTFVCSGGVSDAYEFTAPVDAKYLYFTISGTEKTVVSVVPETGLKEVLNTLSSTISTQGESITSLISSLSSELKKIDLLDYTKVLKNSINLYDIDSVERGYFLGSGGRKSYVAAWLNSRGLLKVFWGNNTKVTLNCCGANGGAYVCQFDADDNFISGTSQGELDTSVTITKAEGSSYVYLEVLISNVAYPQINYGETLGDYTPYNPIDRYLDGMRALLSEKVSEKVDNYSTNLYQESLAEWGYWISTSGNKNYTAAWATSRGLFKVKWGNNTKLTVNCAYASGGTYTAQFDSTGTYIADSKVDGTGTQTYTKVSGADYIYVAIGYSTPNKQIVFGESLLDPYVSYNPISGYIPGIKTSLQPVTKHLYANSSTGTDDATHFYGLSAIQNAINAVPQQSADNYVIHVKGSYYFDTPSKFYNAPDYDIYYYGFYISPTQRNITIIGEGIERTKVVGCLADNLGSTFAYDKYITAEVLGDNCKVVGMTISAQNMRYAVHLDRSGYDYCNNYHITYENCKLTHQGNTGNAATVWGATPSPFGLGISSGMTVTMKECHIEKKGGTALYCHDNRNLEEPYLLEFINCTIITKGSSLLTVANLGSNVNGVIKLIGNHNYYGGTVIAQLTNSGLNVADYGIPLTRIISDNPSRLHYLPQDSDNNGRVLKFTANTAGQSVRIYDTYSGFETLIKGKYGYNGNSFSGIIESDGYRYLDGAADYAGWAMGLKALDMGTNASIQKRLGDCSSTNIKLAVGLYGETPQEIVFDKNYTDYSDADMLDEINNQLTGITAKLYWLAMDYYPETPSLLTCENNTSGVTIKKGMGVHIDGGYVTKATSNEELNAIALDDIKYGCWGRVIKKAVLNTSYYDYNVVLIENDSKNYSDGAKFSIGTTAGVFVRDDTNGILKIGSYSNIIVDL